MLTAPAGAGKTTTIGAATRIWEQHGYQVTGLAPSARAAAELGKATGGPRTPWRNGCTDTATPP